MPKNDNYNDIANDTHNNNDNVRKPEIKKVNICNRSIKKKPVTLETCD